MYSVYFCFVISYDFVNSPSWYWWTMAWVACPSPWWPCRWTSCCSWSWLRWSCWSCQYSTLSRLPSQPLPQLAPTLSLVEDPEGGHTRGSWESAKSKAVDWFHPDDIIINIIIVITSSSLLWSDHPHHQIISFIFIIVIIFLQDEVQYICRNISFWPTSTSVSWSEGERAKHWAVEKIIFRNQFLWRMHVCLVNRILS